VARPVVAVRVTIVRWVSDDPWPGLVECQLADRDGRIWRFVEKGPVVSDQSLGAESEYPQPGVIACQVVSRSRDESGRETAEIDTEPYWRVESVDSITRFEVFADQLVALGGPKD